MGAVNDASKIEGVIREAFRQAGEETARQVKAVQLGMPKLVEAIRTSYGLPISRELAIEHGAIEPTPEERTAMERQHAEMERLEAERSAKLAALRSALAEITEEPARMILDLHHEDERGECAGDDFDGYEAERPDWPCTTVITIAKHYGIDIPERA